MNKLEEYRNKINSIDNEILNLFDERMSICQEIGQLKKEHNLPVTDNSREKQIIEKISSRTSKFTEYDVQLMKNIISLSKELQKNGR